MKFFLQYILTALAQKTLWKYRPLVVGITGSVGKTSARDAIFSVLSGRHRVRRSEKNYNTEIGVPLTILGIPHYGRNIFGWFSPLIRAAVRVLIHDQNFPEILVVEMGADHPGDIAHLVNLAPPLVGIISAIGEVPVHVEFFNAPEELAEEKAKLIEALPPEGYAVLNFDDEVIRRIKTRTRAHILSYGFAKDADVRIMNYELRIMNSGGRSTSAGSVITLEHNGKSVSTGLRNTFGKQQASAAAAAAAVGLVFNMDLTEIAEALRHYESPPGRLKMLRGNKGSLILDDSYNASPQASHAALESLQTFPARRRIALLADMLELGRFTESAHRELGRQAAKVADIFIGVGERMKFALDEAGKGNGTNDKSFSRDQMFWFATAEEAGEKIDQMLQPGDVVLIKGSQSMRMERAVKEVMADPEKASELLVRQTVDWLQPS